MSNYELIIEQNNTELQSNNTDLQGLLDTINALPVAENLDAVLEDHGDAITEQDALIANIQTALESKAGREEIFNLILASSSSIDLIGQDVRVKNCAIGESSSLRLSSCYTEITNCTIDESSSFSISSCNAKITGCLFDNSSSFNSENSNLHLEYCSILDDTSFNHGGGHCTLINCMFGNCSINLNAYEAEVSYTITGCNFNNCSWGCDYTSGALHDALVAGGNIINGVPVT